MRVLVSCVMLCASARLARLEESVSGAARADASALAATAATAGAAMQGGCCCKAGACNRIHARKKGDEGQILGWRQWTLQVEGQEKTYCCKNTRSGWFGCPSGLPGSRPYSTAGHTLHKHLPPGTSPAAGDTRFLCRNPECPDHASPYTVVMGGEAEPTPRIVATFGAAGDVAGGGLLCRCNPGWAAFQASSPGNDAFTRASLVVRALGSDRFTGDVAYDARVQCRPVDCPPNSEPGDAAYIEDSELGADVCVCKKGFSANGLRWLNTERPEDAKYVGTCDLARGPRHSFALVDVDTMPAAITQALNEGRIARYEAHQQALGAPGVVADGRWECLPGFEGSLIETVDRDTPTAGGRWTEERWKLTVDAQGTVHWDDACKKVACPAGTEERPGGPLCRCKRGHKNNGLDWSEATQKYTWAGEFAGAPACERVECEPGEVYVEAAGEPGSCEKVKCPDYAHDDTGLCKCDTGTTGWLEWNADLMDYTWAGKEGGAPGCKWTECPANAEDYDFDDGEGPEWGCRCKEGWKASFRDFREPRSRLAALGLVPAHFKRLGDDLLWDVKTQKWVGECEMVSCPENADPASHPNCHCAENTYCSQKKLTWMRGDDFAPGKWRGTCTPLPCPAYSHRRGGPTSACECKDNFFGELVFDQLDAEDYSRDGVEWSGVCRPRDGACPCTNDRYCGMCEALYAKLGRPLTRQASASKIKGQYRRLAIAYHPDKLTDETRAAVTALGGNPAEVFKKIQVCYDGASWQDKSGAVSASYGNCCSNGPVNYQCDYDGPFWMADVPAAAVDTSVDTSSSGWDDTSTSSLMTSSSESGDVGDVD